MKNIIKFSLAFVAFFFVACSSPSAEDTALEFSENLYAGKSDKVLASMYFGEKTLQAGEKEMLDGKLKAIAAEGLNKANQHGGIDKFEIDKATSKIEENDARVRVNVYFKDGQNANENIRLKKVEGEWKVLLK